MNNPAIACPYDATVQQSVGHKRFPWSGFCKSGMIRLRVSIQTRVNNNQRARASEKSRSGNLSRRIEWRNSLWPQRFWCPLSRRPVRKSPPIMVSISSRFRPRSMLSQARQRADITKSKLGQGVSSASTLSFVNKQYFYTLPNLSLIRFARSSFLWSISCASATFLKPRHEKACAEARLASRTLTALSAASDNRSFQCQRPQSLLPSVQLWRWQHAHARPLSQSTHQCQNPSSWSLRAPRAEVSSFSGQTGAFGPDTPMFALSFERGQAC